jgi:hypothetical protein
VGHIADYSKTPEKWLVVVIGLVTLPGYCDAAKLSKPSE